MDYFYLIRHNVWFKNVRMKQVLLVLLIGYTAVCSAQTTNNDGVVTGEKTDQEAYMDGAETQSNKALVIPFESKMYMSSIDKDLAAKTGMSYQQIRQNMRFGLTNEMYMTLHGSMEAVSLMHLDTGDVEKELQYIYSSIGYHYSEVPQEQLTPVEGQKPDGDASAKDKVKYSLNKFVNKTKEKIQSIGDDEEEEPTQSSGIQNGEVVTTYDNAERYMKTSIHNPNLLSQLNQKFGADLFIFINQLDIERAADPSKKGLGSNEYKRKIKVHYTVFNLKGKEVATGASISYFPNNTNDMNIIIKSHMGAIAQQIATEAKTQPLIAAEDKKKTDTRSEIEKY